VLFGNDEHSAKVEKLMWDLHVWKHAEHEMQKGRKFRDKRLIRSSCPEELQMYCGNEPNVHMKNLLVLASLLRHTGALNHANSGVDSVLMPHPIDNLLAFAPSNAIPSDQSEVLELRRVLLRDLGTDYINPPAGLNTYNIAPHNRDLLEQSIERILKIDDDTRISDYADLVAIMSALSIPHSVIQALSAEEVEEEDMLKHCKTFQNSIKPLVKLMNAFRRVDGRLRMKSKIADFMLDAIWITQAHAMGSNMVVPPPADLEWLSSWSELALIKMPGRCPNVYPEMDARTAAMYKMHYQYTQTPKVDFLEEFNDDTIKHLSHCLALAELPECDLSGDWAVGFKRPFNVDSDVQPEAVLFKVRNSPCDVDVSAFAKLRKGTGDYLCEKKAEKHEVVHLVYSLSSHSVECSSDELAPRNVYLQLPQGPWSPEEIAQVIPDWQEGRQEEGPHDTTPVTVSPSLTGASVA